MHDVAPLAVGVPPANLRLDGPGPPRYLGGPVGTALWEGADLHPIWPVLYSAGLAISFLYCWPTLLALVSRAAPANLNATLMGFCFMTLFVSNTLIGWIGGFYESMSAAAFWSMHAGIAAGGGVVLALFGRRLDRVLRSADRPPRPLNGS